MKLFAAALLALAACTHNTIVMPSNNTVQLDIAHAVCERVQSCDPPAFTWPDLDSCANKIANDVFAKPGAPSPSAPSNCTMPEADQCAHDTSAMTCADFLSFAVSSDANLEPASCKACPD